MRRLLFISLLILGAIAALASQPWFEVRLTAGNSLEVAGFDAYPNFGPTLIMDALAIALVLYLHRRWGVIFLIAGIVATGLGALSQLPAVSGSDLGVVAPLVEKATGIASWVAQLEQVVVSHQSTFYGKGTFILLALLTIVQVLAVIDALRKWTPKVKAKVASTKANRDARKVDRSIAPAENATETRADLWNETNPADL